MRGIVRFLLIFGFLVAPGLSANGQQLTKPNCQIKVAPPVVRQPGEPVRITFKTEGATAAVFEDQQLPLSAAPADAPSVLRHPRQTTTYQLNVTGPGGQARCQTSIAVPESLVPRVWPPPNFSHFKEDYLARARDSLAHGISQANLSSEMGWLSYATASLMFEQDLAAVNNHLAEHWSFPAHRIYGFGLFSLDFIRLYGLFNERSGQFRNRLDLKSQRHLEELLFEVVSQTRFSDYEYASNLENVWTMRGSENHAFASQSAYLLASQFLKNSPDFENRRYQDGRLPVEHYEAWRNYFLRLLDERVKRGLFVEVASPTYEHRSRQAIQNIRDFTDDPVLRKKAEMVLDLSYAIIAQESLSGTRGGAKSRVYTFASSFWGRDEDRAYALLFGSGRSFAYKNVQQATSTYSPPGLIMDISHDEARKGSYEMVQRSPGMGEPLSRLVGRLYSDKSIYRYAFASPAYVLASFVLDPRGSYLTPSSQNRWQGLTCRGGARIAPQVTRLNRNGRPDKEQRVQNGFASLQDRNTLITQRSNYQKGYTARTDLYFDREFKIEEEANGWIFAREKDCFVAVKVVNQSEKSYDWIDPVTKNQNHEPAKNFVTLRNPDSPIVLVVNQASDYGNDFAAFRDAVGRQKIDQSDGVLRFSRLTYYGPSKIGERDGRPVDVLPPLVYDSPFLRSFWASGLIALRYGNESLILDFRNPNDPVRLVNEGANLDIPPSRGQTMPVVFPTR
jgi:hypothetical protein